MQKKKKNTFRSDSNKLKLVFMHTHLCRTYIENHALHLWVLLLCVALQHSHNTNTHDRKKKHVSIPLDVCSGLLGSQYNAGDQAESATCTMQTETQPHTHARAPRDWVSCKTIRAWGSNEMVAKNTEWGGMQNLKDGRERRRVREKDWWRGGRPEAQHL